MTCVDSSLVLRDLLIYLSESRDLTGGDTIKCSNTEYKNSNSATTDTLTNGASNGTSNTTTNGEDQVSLCIIYMYLQKITYYREGGREKIIYMYTVHNNNNNYYYYYLDYHSCERLSW